MDLIAHFAKTNAKVNEYKFMRKIAPLEILFLKRNQDLYLVFMSVNNENVPMDSDMLYNLIVKRPDF